MVTTTTPAVLITGATGNTGSAVSTELARRGVPYRAMVRNASDGERLAAPAESLAVADFDDADSLTAALSGVERAYLVTPSTERAEEQQLRFVDAAAATGVHIVLLSQLAAAVDSPVRFLRYHAVVENRIRELGLPFTFLRPNLYYQGLLAFVPTIAAEGRFFAPIGAARVSAIDVRDIGAVAATILTGSGHEGRTYDLTGPAALTHTELAAALSRALSTEVTFVDVPPDRFAAALTGVLPPWQVEGLVEDYAHYARGEAAAVSPAVEEITGRAPRGFDEFVADHLDAFR